MGNFREEGLAARFVCQISDPDLKELNLDATDILTYLRVSWE
jgi:hypothetical protein